MTGQRSGVQSLPNHSPLLGTRAAEVAEDATGGDS